MRKKRQVYCGMGIVLSLLVACSGDSERSSGNLPSASVTRVLEEPKPAPTIKPKSVTSSEPLTPIQHDGEVRYYDTTDITTPALPIDSLQYYEREVQTYLDSGASLVTWDTGSPLKLADLDWAEIYAVHISLTMERIHEEKDLILHSDTEEYRVVSVAHEPNRVIRVSKSRPWEPKYPRVLQERIRQQYHLYSIEDGSSKWKQKALNILADAFTYLSPKEQQYFTDVRFIRESVGEASQSGLYHFEVRNGVVEQSITIFDSAFHGMKHSFCGSITEPKSAAHVVIIHEMGHLIANRPIVEFELRYNQLVDSYNAKVSAYNQHNTDQLEKEIQVLGKELELMQSNPVQRPGPIVEAFLTHRQFGEGPTEYGNTSVHEAFAESYALFKLDPEALQRIDPMVHQWFASGGYLQFLD